MTESVNITGDASAATVEASPKADKKTAAAIADHSSRLANLESAIRRLLYQLASKDAAHANAAAAIAAEHGLKLE